MLWTLFYFLLALLLLVTVHEYGHFQIARWCGIKVLRFSFGFGKVLARWQDKKGTEFVFSLVPLGGYVKMLDENEDEVPESEKHLAFNNQSLWKRTAVVVAGPLFNFIFAIIALWLVAMIGIKSLAPIIESVKPDSLAAKAGITSKQEIIALDGKPIHSWHDFQYALMPYIGSKATVVLTLTSTENSGRHEVSLPLTDWKLDGKNPNLLDSFGFIPFVPSIPPIIGKVYTGSPADSGGLRVNDRVISLDGKTIDDWMAVVDYVKSHPDKMLEVVVDRNGLHKTIKVRAGSKSEGGHKEGFLGLTSQKVDWPENWLREQKERPLQALGSAIRQTVDLTGATFILMGRLVTGQLALQSISGPVGIAQGAGESAKGGFVYYLSFLALISISLGALNLLPIPMLDGGHLLYYAIELIKGKPLSEGWKSIGMYLGMVLLVGMMLIALTNDLSRLMS